MPYASNNNAILIDNCNNLENLSVLLEITEDVPTTDGSGWSFQLNCYPPPGQYCQTSQVNWMQYVVYVQNGNLTYEVQYWSYGSSTWPPGYTPQPNTTPWLPCWANDYFLSSSFASISGDTLPRQSSLQIALSTNDAGGVTKVQFIYTDPDGNAHPAEFDPPAVHPIVACELNLVGPGGSANANFTQGLTSSRGIIYYSVSSGQLSVQNGGAGSACGEVGVFTAETSNMTYSDISDAPGSTVTQTLQQPVDCAVNNLFAARPAHLGDMRQVQTASSPSTLPANGSLRCSIATPPTSPSSPYGKRAVTPATHRIFSWKRFTPFGTNAPSKARSLMKPTPSWSRSAASCRLQ
jgi:hypothetical protein